MLHEPTEVLRNLASKLQDATNTGQRLLLADNRLEAEVENTYSEDKDQEADNAGNYFNIHGRYITVSNALFAVNNLLTRRNTEPYQDPETVYKLQLAAQSMKFSSAAESKIDAEITRAFFDTTGEIPSSANRKRYVDAYIGLSILRQFGLSTLNQEASLEKNGTMLDPKETIAKVIANITQHEEINRQQISVIANKLLTHMSLHPPTSTTLFHKLPRDLTPELLQAIRFIGTDLNSRSLKGIPLGALSIGDFKLDTTKETQHSLACSKADFSTTRLINQDISKSTFSEANFTNAKLLSVSSINTDYKNATFAGATFCDVDFSNCDFSGANLKNIQCKRVNFTGAKLADADISLSLELLAEVSTAYLRDTHINHRNNENQGLLITINSIDSKYETQKNALMASVIAQLNSLSDSELTGSWDSLADVLLKEPCFAKDPTIARFIEKRLLPQWMSDKNQAILRKDDADLALVLTYLNATDSSHHWSTRDFQGAVNQLLCAATSTENQADLNVQQAAEHLRTAYLRSPVVKDAAARLEAVNGDLSRETYIFTSRDGRQAVALDPELFKGLVSTAPGELVLTHGYLLSRASESEPFNIDPFTDVPKAYAMQPLLNACYALIHSGISRDLVSGILGDSPHATTFIGALSQHSISNKLVAPAHEGELYDAFAAHWLVTEGDVHEPQNTSRHLRPEHQEQLWQAIKDLSLDDTRHDRAALMLILSSMFTRYSSSYFVGTEYESPPAVRLYASALLNEARLLDPSLIDDQTATNWQARLLGIGDAFTCTAVLSGMMNDYVKNKAQPDSPLERMSLMLYPPAWR